MLLFCCILFVLSQTVARRRKKAFLIANILRFRRCCSFCCYSFIVQFSNVCACVRMCLSFLLFRQCACIFMLYWFLTTVVCLLLFFHSLSLSLPLCHSYSSLPHIFTRIFSIHSLGLFVRSFALFLCSNFSRGSDTWLETRVLCSTHTQ